MKSNPFILVFSKKGGWRGKRKQAVLGFSGRARLLLLLAILLCTLCCIQPSYYYLPFSPLVFQRQKTFCYFTKSNFLHWHFTLMCVVCYSYLTYYAHATTAAFWLRQVCGSTSSSFLVNYLCTMLHMICAGIWYGTQRRSTIASFSQKILRLPLTWLRYKIGHLELHCLFHMYCLSFTEKGKNMCNLHTSAFVVKRCLHVISKPEATLLL